jgi:PAS domain S-box-containing protein
MERKQLARPFMLAVVAAGFAASLSSLFHLEVGRLDLRFAALALVTLGLSARVTVKIPGVNSAVTVSDTLIFLTLLLYGVEAAALLAAADAFCASFRHCKTWLTVTFGAAVGALSTFAAGGALRLCFGEAETLADGRRPGELAAALILLSLVSFFSHTALTAAASALKSGQTVWRTWKDHCLWTSVTYFAGAATAGVIARLLGSYGPYPLLAAAPIILFVYFTYYTYLKRVETSEAQARQAERHVAELSYYVAELEQAEAALRQSESDYRGLFEAAHDAILIITPEDEVVLDVNQRACEIYGLSRAEFIGRSMESLSKDCGPGGEQLRWTLETGACRNFETVQRRRDGSEMFLEINAAPINYKGRRAVLSINRDVTERRRAEEALRASEEQLRQSQKMEAVGQLAGGVAHDFNNLMTAVIGYSVLLLDELEEASPLREDVEEIKLAAERAAALTRQLLAFSRKQMLQPKVLDLNATVSHMEKMLRRLIPEDIILATALDPALERVEADPGQIEQVILNLALNARDAMPGGGRLTLETRNARVGLADAPGLEGLRPGRYVSVVVSDTGCGMDAETRRHIFEPFFTTKEVGKGTGLGLSTVYGIVKQSGGEVRVESEPGRGTAFEVYLPSAVGADGGAAEASLPAPLTPEAPAREARRP